MSNINEMFIEQMKKELKENEYKGNWEDWTPTEEDWFWETMKVIMELQNSIKYKNNEEIMEFAADLGNYAEKAYTAFGLKSK
jgi:pterin-4a-carbinolamine dehydratase